MIDRSAWFSRSAICAVISNVQHRLPFLARHLQRNICRSSPECCYRLKKHGRPTDVTNCSFVRSSRPLLNRLSNDAPAACLRQQLQQPHLTSPAVIPLQCWLRQRVLQIFARDPTSHISATASLLSVLTELIFTTCEWRVVRRSVASVSVCLSVPFAL